MGEEAREVPLAASADPAQGNLDIILNNVVCNYSVRCHLNLRQIATTGNNVEYHKSMAMIVMKFRRPRCTASIWSSGKITMTGATTEEDAKLGARRCARVIQKLGYNAKFTNYRVVNVLATCTMPFAIKISEFATAYPRIASYEPELHPGCTYRLDDIGATLKIFSTGSITITGKSVDAIQKAVEKAYALVFEFKKERRIEDLQNYPIHERKKRRRELRLLQEQLKTNKPKRPTNNKSNSRPPKKRARHSRDTYEEDGISEEETPLDEFEELESLINFKTPIEVESDEEEAEEDFDSDASHD